MSAVINVERMCYRLFTLADLMSPTSKASVTFLSLKKKIIRQKQLILFTTFTLHIKLHSEVHWRRNALNVLLGVYTFRSSDRPVGPTQATSDCRTDRSDRL